VTDPVAARRSRPMRETGLPHAARLELFVTEAGAHGLSASSLSVRLGVPPDATTALVKKCRTVERVGERLYSADLLDELQRKLVSLVRSHHESRPLEPGAPRQDVRSRLSVDAALFDHLVASAVAHKKIEASGAELRAAGFAAELSTSQTKLADDLLAAIEAAGAEPPSVSELQAQFGTDVVSVLRHLERQQRVVPVEHERYYAPSAVRRLLEKLEKGMAGRGELAPTDLREVLGFSRKFLIPFLEYCDRRGYTQRNGNSRTWRMSKPA
jgi:selenocysteine-specific elongation factor